MRHLHGGDLTQEKDCASTVTGEKANSSAEVRVQGWSFHLLLFSQCNRDLAESENLGRRRYWKFMEREEMVWVSRARGWRATSHHHSCTNRPRLLSQCNCRGEQQLWDRHDGYKAENIYSWSLYRESSPIPDLEWERGWTWDMAWFLGNAKCPEIKNFNERSQHGGISHQQHLARKG